MARSLVEELNAWAVPKSITLSWNFPGDELSKRISIFESIIKEKEKEIDTYTKNTKELYIKNNNLNNKVSELQSIIKEKEKEINLHGA